MRSQQLQSSRGTRVGGAASTCREQRKTGGARRTGVLVRAGLELPPPAGAGWLKALSLQLRGPAAPPSGVASPDAAATLAPPPPPGAGPKDPTNKGGVDGRYRLFLDEWDKGFMDADEDPEGYWVDVVHGAIPAELTGTFFRNGPGRFTLGGQHIAHPYDGDGLVASLAFRGGAAYFRSRFVQTPEYRAEREAQAVLFRGTFATQRPGGPGSNAFDLYVKNTSNTNVVCHGGRLWSLFEAGQPYRLNPRTLQTEGLETLDGRLSAGLPFDLGSASSNRAFAGLTRLAQARLGLSRHLPAELKRAGGDAVTAHPHLDAATGRLVTFSYRVLPAAPSTPGQPLITTRLTFWELDDDMRPAATKDYTLQGFAFLHDFALTPNYYVVFQNPVTVDNAPYLLGVAPAASCVRWAPNTPTLVHIIPRPGAAAGAAARTFTAPPLFVFHHANAFEVGAEGEGGGRGRRAGAFEVGKERKKGGGGNGPGRRLVVDSIHYDSLPAVGREATAAQRLDADAAFTPRLRRMELDLDTHVMTVRRAFDGYLEMPAVSPARVGLPHRFVYGYHSVFEDPQVGIAKVDVEGRQVELWLPGACRFALEPRFVPRRRRGTLGGKEESAEDDGWLVAQLFDSATMQTEVVILDAANLAAGPVAVLRLRRALPSALHSCWSETYYGPGEESTPPPDEGGGHAHSGADKAANVVPFSAKEAARLKGSGERRAATAPSRRLTGLLPFALAQLLLLGGGVGGDGA